MRKSSLSRKTNETNISINLNIDGVGNYKNNTGIGFLDHMLDLFAKHGRFDLEVTCDGDTHVDFHHSAEDVGILLGKAFLDALGDMKGINRYGNFTLPMDEVLMLCAVDISGRRCLGYDVNIKREKVGDFDTELAKEFMDAFANNLGATLHFKQFSGENAHHVIEALFKSLAKAMMQAVSINEKFADDILSTKGVL